MNMRFKNIVFLFGMLFGLGLQAGHDRVAQRYPYSCTAVYVAYDEEIAGFVIAARDPKQFGDYPETISMPFLLPDELGRVLHLAALVGYGKIVKVDDFHTRAQGSLFLTPEIFGLRPGTLNVSTKGNPKGADLSVDLSKSCYGFECAGMFSRG